MSGSERVADDGAGTRWNGFPVEVPFALHLGTRNIPCEPGRSCLEIDLAKHHQNSFGMAHGGVVLTLSDVSMAMAAQSVRNEADGDGGIVTIEMKTSFIGAGYGTLIARGTVIQRTKTMAFCESEVRDAKDTLVARASGTFKFQKRRAGAPANASD